MCKISGNKKKNKEGLQYPSLSLAIRPALHGPDIPIPTLPLSQTEISSPSDVEDDDILLPTDIERKNLQPFNQSELNCLVCDLENLMRTYKWC
jgi:hypothetical protein